MGDWLMKLSQDDKAPPVERGGARIVLEAVEGDYAAESARCTASGSRLMTLR